MSMLSSQCNKLRGAAIILEDEGVMPACAKLMRDAADTIWELRNDCVELRDERDRLQKLANQQSADLECMTFKRDHLYVEAAERIAEILAENERLRELCEDMYGYARTLGYDHPLLRELGIIDSD